MEFDFGDRVRVVADGDKLHGRVGVVKSYFPSIEMWAVQFYGDDAPGFPLFYRTGEIEMKKTYEEVKKKIYGR